MSQAYSDPKRANDPRGPYATEADALADARESAGMCPHGCDDDTPCNECPAPELWVLQNLQNGARLVYTTTQGLRSDVPVSCWCSKEAAERQAKSLGLDAFMSAVRLNDDEARDWGTDAQRGSE